MVEKRHIIVTSGWHRESTCLTVTPGNRSLSLATESMARFEIFNHLKKEVWSLALLAPGALGWHSLGCSHPAVLLHLPTMWTPHIGLMDCSLPNAVLGPIPKWSGNLDTGSVSSFTEGKPWKWKLSIISHFHFHENEAVYHISSPCGCLWKCLFQQYFQNPTATSNEERPFTLFCNNRCKAWLCYLQVMWLWFCHWTWLSWGLNTDICKDIRKYVSTMTDT